MAPPPEKKQKLEMPIFTSAADMRAWSRQQRREGKRIAFVPTMASGRLTSSRGFCWHMQRLLAGCDCPTSIQAILGPKHVPQLVILIKAIPLAAAGVSARGAPVLGEGSQVRRA